VGRGFEALGRGRFEMAENDEVSRTDASAEVDARCLALCNVQHGRAEAVPSAPWGLVVYLHSHAVPLCPVQL